MKFGLDVHGVIDKFPKVFSALSHALIAAGHEVHIITGPSQTSEFEAELRALGMVWTHFCSIIDYRKSQGVTVTYDERGHGWVRAEQWDSAKAEYCLEHEIDFHIDDSEEYSKYFRTPYAKITSQPKLVVTREEVEEVLAPLLANPPY